MIATALDGTRSRITDLSPNDIGQSNQKTGGTAVWEVIGRGGKNLEVL